jgi:hypothetical protein
MFEAAQQSSGVLRWHLSTPSLCCVQKMLRRQKIKYIRVIQHCFIKRIYLIFLSTKYCFANLSCDAIYYFLSEKCKAVFIPEVWHGIKGIDDLRLQTQDPLSSSIKPPAIPVSKRVFEPAQKEFERMLTYFYTKVRVRGHHRS